MREVHGITHKRVLGTLIAPDQRGGHYPCRQADSELKNGESLPLPSPVDRELGSVHRLGCHERAIGMIGEWLEGAEHRHH